MDVHAALTDVRSSATILDGMRAGERLEDVARSAGPEVVDHLVVATTDPDPITAIAAVHALGAHGSATAGAHLVSLLDDERAHVAEHAIDALSGVVAQAAALERLVRHCAEGGFPGMLAARTLERGAAASPDAVEHAVTVGLASERDPAARAHLEELAQDLRSGARDATKPPTRGGRASPWPSSSCTVTSTAACATPARATPAGWQRSSCTSGTPCCVTAPGWTG